MTTITTSTTTKKARDGQASRLPNRTRDRRPAMAALAILLVMLGALGSALIAYRTGDRVDVLVAARELPQGAQVSREDFTVARVANDGGSVVEEAAVDNFLGAYTTSRIPEGTLVANSMFTKENVLPQGGQLVGVTAAATLRPSLSVQPSDVIALYSVPAEGQEGAESAVVVESARVVHVAAASANSDTVHLTVLISDGTVAQVVALSARGQLAMTGLPDDVAPVIDLRSQ